MRKYTRIFAIPLYCFVLLLLAGFAPPLHAGTVTLTLVDPAGDGVLPGGSFDVSVDLDLTDEAHEPPVSFGGAVVISFDDSFLTLDSFTPSGAATIVNGEFPTVPPIDCAQNIVLCFVDAPELASIGTFTFTLSSSAEPGQLLSIGIADADDGFGSFANQLPTNQAVFPDFIGTSVMAIPLPAAGWLVVSGLAVFGCRARRRR